MYKLIPFALLTALTCTACPASQQLNSSTTVTVNPNGSQANSVDPARVRAFEAEFKTLATTPQGAVKCLLKALVPSTDTPELSKTLLTVVLDSRKITEDSSSPTGFKLGNSELFLFDQIAKKPNIVKSYLGGTPEKGYADFDASANTFNFPADGEVLGEVKVDNSAEKEGATEGRIYVKSSGKDIATPIKMAKNSSGLWKIDPSSLSSLATGVKTAESGDF